MKMDVSKFKKISSDDKKTVFRHPNGHKIVVAHAPLGKKLKEGLDKLPMYAEGSENGPVEPAGNMVPGNNSNEDVAPNPAEAARQKAFNEMKQPSELQQAVGRLIDAAKNTDYSSGYTPSTAGANVQRQPAQEVNNAPAPAQVSEAPPPPVADQVLAKEANAKPPAPMNAAPEPQDDNTSTSAPPTQDMPPQAAVQGDNPNPDNQAAMQDQKTQQNYQKGFHDYYQEHAQQLGTEDAAWQHDLANGHITPETYHDLYAKRDTLGKVGMLFGIMMSSMGAGLSHQPNNALAAMNQEIENDLKAQTQSKDNAKNFLQLHMQQQLNQAQIKHLGQEGELNEAQAQNLRTESAIKAKAFALANMNRSALHEMVLRTQAMPEGPQKQQAMNALGMMAGAVDANVYNINDVAAGQLARLSMMKDMMGGQNGQGPNTSVMRMMGMKDMAEDIDKKNVPGVGVAKVPLTAEDRDGVNSGVNFQNELSRFTDWTKKNSGSLNPSKIAEGHALAAQLSNAYRQAIHGGVYKEGEQGFIGSIIDQNPTKFFNSIRVLPKLQAVQQESSAQLNQLLKSKGLPAMQGQSGGVQEGATGVSNSGKPIVYRGGKWMYK